MQVIGSQFSIDDGAEMIPQAVLGKTHISLLTEGSIIRPLYAEHNFNREPDSSMPLESARGRRRSSVETGSPTAMIELTITMLMTAADPVSPLSHTFGTEAAYDESSFVLFLFLIFSYF